MTAAEIAVRELVDRETRAWDTRDGWKMTAHTGLLDYGQFGRASP